MKARRLMSVSGARDLSQELLSWLLSHNCWANEDGTEGGFTVHLCCDSAEVKVRARKVRDNFNDEGEYSHSDYTVTAFTVRQHTEDE